MERGKFSKDKASIIKQGLRKIERYETEVK